ncbi:hypothetical protein [Allorhodopirellula solitaria]|uniref:hypothetical protein n=1 Tax=Allorhodopirellula solitaria TaxID=2527987 RepID=UPI001FE62073|nr:hypothetical protein [Allorhodopirellula solitaria]
MLVAPTRLQAGLTGENVALIVNGSSTDSLTIANHYAALRDIPSHNVIVLEDVPSELSISLDAFRDGILKPLLETINSRGIAPQIRVVAYSAGFPTSVNIGELAKRFPDPADSKYRTPVASINSLTYFYRWVLSDSPNLLAWGANLYARGPFGRHFANPFSGENAQQFEAAISDSKAEKFTEAAESMQSLADQFPTLFPLRILAAENWLRSGEEDKALAQVRKSIERGWINRRYLIETEPLSQLFGGDAVDLPGDRRRLLDQLEDVPHTMQGPIGFSNTAGWTNCGHAVKADEGGMPYMLSCVLAVVHKNGSTLQQAIDSLSLAAPADRTYPDATFGFSKTKDVRSKTRFPVTTDALSWLLSRNDDVEIFSSALPSQSGSYVGMMLGAASLPLSNKKWTFASGAIAENLTSFGGMFQNNSQTKLTALLHAGAAMSSGTVTEPYSLPPKFPSAMMYPYYSEGVAAIEAFYLSVPSPYQLLIVGDPLCQPFARAPNDFVRIESKPPAIEITWQSLPRTPDSVPTAAIELYLNGKSAGRIRPTPKIRVNLPANAEGVVDVRVSLIGAHPTQPRIGTHRNILVGEESHLPQIEQTPSDTPGEMTVSVACDEAESIHLIHLGRVIHTFESDSGDVTLTPAQIGTGPVRLQANAQRDGSIMLGRPVEIEW